MVQVVAPTGQDAIRFIEPLDPSVIDSPSGAPVTPRVFKGNVRDEVAKPSPPGGDMRIGSQWHSAPVNWRGGETVVVDLRYNDAAH
ncbi:MAG: hypothetical protein P4N24_09950 [Acidobacteriota bacterium]|nr:hypothetical protein [Acidobacteriota bacterium]